MQTSPLELTVQHASKPSALNANDPRIPVTASPPGTVSADEQTQRQARQSWYAEAREHPEVGVRLQALEFWTQQTGDVLDPVTYALVDGDEHVRARAQELWEQQLMREAAAARSVQEEGHRGQLQQ